MNKSIRYRYRSNSPTLQLYVIPSALFYHFYYHHPQQLQQGITMEEEKLHQQLLPAHTIENEALQSTSDINNNTTTTTTTTDNHHKSITTTPITQLGELISSSTLALYHYHSLESKVVLESTSSLAIYAQYVRHKLSLLQDMNDVYMNTDYRNIIIDFDALNTIDCLCNPELDFIEVIQDLLLTIQTIMKVEQARLFVIDNLM